MARFIGICALIFAFGFGGEYLLTTWETKANNEEVERIKVQASECECVNNLDSVSLNSILDCEELKAILNK